MKLLTPQDAQSAQGKEISLSLLRIQELVEVEKQYRIKIAKAEADYNDSLVKHYQKTAELEGEFMTRKKELEGEIQKLQEDRKRALAPVMALQNEVIETKHLVDEVKKHNDSRTDELDDLQESLEERLDSLGEKEVAVEGKYEWLQQKEESIEAQAQLVRNQSELLTKEMSDWFRQKSQEEVELRDKEEKVLLREKTVAAKEELLQSHERNLHEREARLQDERQTLDRAWQEVQRISPPTE